MKHTGKSQHGTALARALGWEFCDTDALMQELDSTETRMRRPVRDIYLEDGVQRFQQLEAAACRLAASRGEQFVIAAGGGVCDNPDAIEAMTDGVRVHLVDSFDAISNRIFRGGIPAFLHTDDKDIGRERFREIYERRVAAYDALADLRVDLRGASLSEARSRLIRSVKEYLSGRK